MHIKCFSFLYKWDSIRSFIFYKICFYFCVHNRIYYKSTCKRFCFEAIYILKRSMELAGSNFNHTFVRKKTTSLYIMNYFLYCRYFTMILSHFISGNSVSLSSLRVFRVFRAFKTVNILPGNILLCKIILIAILLF